MRVESAFYTVKEIMELLHIGKTKAYRLLKTEGIPYVNFKERYIRIPKEGFKEWCLEKGLKVEGVTHFTEYGTKTYPITTIGELKKIIADIPDYTEIFVDNIGNENMCCIEKSEIEITTYEHTKDVNFSINIKAESRYQFGIFPKNIPVKKLSNSNLYREKPDTVTETEYIEEMFKMAELRNDNNEIL